MTLKLSNNASSLLSTGIDDSVTTLAITSGDEGNFPSLSGGDWCPLTVTDGAGNIEIMRCTARSGVTLTVVRGQEGTTAQSFEAGASVSVRLTSGAITDLLARSNHTGEQAQSTITGLVAALAALAADIDGLETADTLKAPIANPTFTGAVTLPGDPASALQAATKQYVDALAVNVGRRGSVRAATTANITIATALNNGDSLDGVTLATGDLVLVKNQSSAAENGIYVVGASPARYSEFDTYDEHAGALIAVHEGTANADKIWLCTSNKGGTLSSTAIVFALFQPVGAASTTDAGIVELSDTTEAIAGTDTARAVTPAGLRAFADANLYAGSNAANTTFPIGKSVLVNNSSGVARNASAAVRLHEGNTAAYNFSGSGSLLSGTWRGAGQTEEGTAKMDRTS